MKDLQPLLPADHFIDSQRVLTYSNGEKWVWVLAPSTAHPGFYDRVKWRIPADVATTKIEDAPKDELRERVLETLQRYRGQTDTAGLLMVMGVMSPDRRRYATRLNRLAVELGEPYVRRSTVARTYMGKTIRPWVWGLTKEHGK